MAGLIFDEKSLIEGNLFKFESRLVSHTQRYIEGGAILTTYWNLADNSTTVDRGMRDVDKLFGKGSPIKFNKILNFPIYGFGAVKPDNTDDDNTEDINVTGDCVILPVTIVPNPNDFFTINHQDKSNMIAIFQITDVSYDSMKPEGYYKITYRLHSTSEATLNDLNNQTVSILHTDLNAIGSNINPVMKEDDFVLRGQIDRMLEKMIHAYKAMFYNERHNVFLFYDKESGNRWFDLCGNMFMAKHSLMNSQGNTNVVILHNKIRDKMIPLYYNNSIYNWFELDGPLQRLESFSFRLSPAHAYKESSFDRWSEIDIFVMQALSTSEVGIVNREYSFFDNAQLESFNQIDIEPSSEFDKLIWKFINKGHSLSINDISLDVASTLLSSVRHRDVFLYTPIIIFIIKKILMMN